MDYATARYNMVESQIRPNRVLDSRVIEAMAEVPRERFVGEDMAGIAYVDEALNIGDGRFLMEPMAFARLLDLAEIGADDVVLDIGCGTGYSAAVLSKLAGTVVAVEEVSGFADSASELLTELGADNVAVIEGSLADGYAKQAPYDAIIFSGAVAEVPDQILDQLADGGRLVCIIQMENGLGRGTLTTKFGPSIDRRDIFDAGSPILPGFESKSEFTF